MMRAPERPLRVRPTRAARALVRQVREELRRVVVLDGPLADRDARAKGHVELADYLNTFLAVKGYGHTRLTRPPRGGTP